MKKMMTEIARNVRNNRNQVLREGLNEAKRPVPTPKDVNLRKFDFPTAKCVNCVYWRNGDGTPAHNKSIHPHRCAVLAQDTLTDDVCDAWQGDEKKFVPYKVKESERQDFIWGMVTLQPYQHIVVKGLNTPVGWLVLIKDTMKPKAHRFSLPFSFHLVHTTREHNWTQAEVDKIIDAGRR